MLETKCLYDFYFISQNPGTTSSKDNFSPKNWILCRKKYHELVLFNFFFNLSMLRKKCVKIAITFFIEEISKRVKFYFIMKTFSNFSKVCIFKKTTVLIIKLLLLK